MIHRLDEALSLRAAGQSYREVRDWLAAQGLDLSTGRVWELLRERGAVPRWRHKIRRAPNWRHVRWLKEYAAGEGLAEIGRRDGVTRQAVHDAIIRLTARLRAATGGTED